MTTSTIIPPDRSSQQRHTALMEANRVRSYRSARAGGLKATIAAGRDSVQRVLLDPEPEVLTMRVMDLLLANRMVGRVRAAKLLRRAGVSPSGTVGGLTGRQRVVLAGLVGGGDRDGC